MVVHFDAAVLADPERPGQSVLEDGARVPRQPPAGWRAMVEACFRDTVARVRVALPWRPVALDTRRRRRA